MKTAFFAILALLAAQCSLPSEVSSVPAPETAIAHLPSGIQAVLSQYEKAWAAKDEHALAALFVEDGFVLSNNHPPVRGRAEIEERYRNSGGPLALRPIAFGVEGSMAYVVGTYARSQADPDLGKFTLVLRQDVGGGWKIVSDMDNQISNR